MTGLCEQKSTDFESRQQLREGEIEALGKAIDMISSNSVAGRSVREIDPKSSVASTALVQMRRSGSSPHLDGESLQRAASLLRQLATALHSPALALLAQRAGQDTFAKVKAMIKDLIVRLREEANAEADRGKLLS